MKHVLVTGGAGFIGSHIVDRLVTDGCQVRVLDDFSTGHRENLAAAGDIQIMEGNVGDPDTVAAAVDGMDVVFHEAAIASVPRTIEDPLGSQKTNYQGTLNVLEAARKASARRVVFASSAAIYGDDPELPKTEDMPARPLSPYAVDKLASEYACQMYWRLYGLETVCLRYFNVYGPRQDPSSAYSGVISVFADRLKNGVQPVIYGDGEQTRDFIYVSDVVAANIAAATQPEVTEEVFNIATGCKVTLNELLRVMAEQCGEASSPAYADARSGDIRHSLADISKAVDLLKFKPRVSLDEGLAGLLESLGVV
jgi:UDP-glucose 4-epimerase